MSSKKWLVPGTESVNKDSLFEFNVSNKHNVKCIELGKLNILVKRESISVCNYNYFLHPVIELSITQIKNIGFVTLFGKELIVMEYNDKTKGYVWLPCKFPKNHKELTIDLIIKLSKEDTVLL